METPEHQETIEAIFAELARLQRAYDEWGAAECEAQIQATNRFRWYKPWTYWGWLNANVGWFE